MFYTSQTSGKAKLLENSFIHFYMKDEKVFTFQRLLCMKIRPLLAHREFKRRCATSKEPHVQWSRLPGQAGYLPTNCRQCLTMGLQLAECWCSGRPRLQASFWGDGSQTQSATFLCKTSFLLAYFILSLLLNSLQDLSLWAFPTNNLVWRR